MLTRSASAWFDIGPRPTSVTVRRSVQHTRHSWQWFLNREGEGMKNSICVIKPYLWEGMWVFDDPAVGLVKEPFVGGVPEMIQLATRDIPQAERGFVAVFSAGHFPDARIVLDWVREEGSGNVYRWPETGQEGWLCPALLKYFDRPPAKLYVQVRPAA
jgi:hypothetical protein